MSEKGHFSILSYFWMRDCIQRRGKAVYTQKEKKPLLKLELVEFSASNYTERKPLDGFLSKTMYF